MNNAGSATVTAYMSFVILILMKLYNAISISNISKKKNIALSAYMSELQSYNILDKDYEEGEKKERNLDKRKQYRRCKRKYSSSRFKHNYKFKKIGVISMLNDIFSPQIDIL